MSQTYPVPPPLFDTLENINATPACVMTYLESLSIPHLQQEFQHCIEFLKSYAQSKDTFTAYRREVERLLHWCWLVSQKPLKEMTRNDMRDYLAFVNTPIKSWIGTKVVDRFIQEANGLRQFNPNWRPFVVKVSKLAHQRGKIPNKAQYQLGNKSMEAIFAILSSMFTYLQQEEYLEINPIALIRQKKGYLQREHSRKVTRKLSHLQWTYVITLCEEHANTHPEHYRTLFLLSAFYLLGLRISELAYGTTRQAIMGNFAPDKRGLWWYTTVGKGNKIRDVAVPDELLTILKKYRESQGLPALPHRNEQTPLLPKKKGKAGLGARQIRNIVQKVFDRAIQQLTAAGKTDEAEDLATATVHWLRHTAISSEVEYRPREHIRDDVGHGSPVTMDKYIDTDRVARHKSAQTKRLNPGLMEETIDAKK